ncbi:MAG: methyltransferase domain-containing protein, partial [Planctomycetales bacterium]|nr:methyltransferase domain-containing protein [Planctomycetales bacterium]
GRRRSPPGRTLGPRTLGPVSDLERHLPEDWWRTLFNSVYLKTDGDVVNDTNAVREVDLLVRAAGLEPNDRILDLCCGQGRHCLELARRGFKNVTGVDRSRYLIRLGKRRAKQLGLSVSLHEGDARKFRLKESDFHCVALMGNSFGYFDREEDDLAVLHAVIRALGPGGGIVALDVTNGDWMRENFVPRSWEWIDQDHFVCRERSLSADATRLISREVVVHAERGVIVDQFYAERLYSRETIVRLLEQAGFTRIREHDAVEADSERNQDLGMMARRMFLTAKYPAVPDTKQKRKTVAREVCVLMGDPRLPDKCKRDGQFNPEDFSTIEKLHDALGELGDYTFRYVDNHASLMSDLRQQPPGFVLNLCDEGFDNDAFKELHVPAMLEMFGIPYSGAGPAALGLCYNKSLVRSIAETLAVPVPLETYVDPDDQSATLPSVWPALVKPTCGDSSVGITVESVVDRPENLIRRVEELRSEFPGVALLVQEFLTGNEYSIGIVGNPGHGYYFLPPLEVDYGQLEAGLPHILGYESKWLPDSPYWNQIKYHEADLDTETTRRLYDQSSLLFERLGCRDYARFDYRADAAGRIKLLEVNPNPGWCWDGKLNFMAGYAGLRYADLLKMIIEAAQARYATNGQTSGA